jgi:uncharacterized membrane protein
VTAEFIVLRLVHVLGGIFWVGSGIFTSIFLVPALATSGPAAGQVMAALQQRRLFTVLPIVAVLTILSGLRLMWLVSGGFAPGYFASATGGTFAASGAAAIVAFALSLLVARPAAIKAAQLGAATAGASDGATRARLEQQVAALRRRGSVASTMAVTLLVLGAAGMATARYL